METCQVDLAIVGAGGAGLRAAIAAAEADPALRIAPTATPTCVPSAA